MDKSLYSFLDGVIVDKTTFRFIGLDDEKALKGIKHGLIFTCKDRGWRAVEVGERLVSCTSTGVQEYSFVAIAESGREVMIGNNGLKQHIIASGADSPEANGPVTQVRCWNNDQIYSVGTARQAYRKRAMNEWDRIDESCKPQSAEARSSAAFLAVDGYSKDEVYAVGWDGEIWMFSGTLWQQLISPTNAMLHALCCSCDGNVYVCGQNGTVLKGRGAVWEVIEQSATSEDLRGLCEFNEVVYLCSADLVYSLTREGLVPVLMGIPCTTSGRLTSACGLLMSVGLKDVALFDGTNWVVVA